MANVKLGNNILTGVESVKLQNADSAGGYVEFTQGGVTLPDRYFCIVLDNDEWTGNVSIVFYRHNTSDTYTKTIDLASLHSGNNFIELPEEIPDNAYIAFYSPEIVNVQNNESSSYMEPGLSVYATYVDANYNYGSSMIYTFYKKSIDVPLNNTASSNSWSYSNQYSSGPQSWQTNQDIDYCDAKLFGFQRFLCIYFSTWEND